MHRAYQPITPANNKLLKKRWDMTRYDTHRRKVCENFLFVPVAAPLAVAARLLIPKFDLSFSETQVQSAKAVIDNKPPQTYMHLHLKLKKLQVKFISCSAKQWSFCFSYSPTVLVECCYV